MAFYGSRTPAREPNPESQFSHRLAVVLLVPLSILLVGLLSTLYINNTTALIEGPSMEPTLLSGEIVLVSRGYELPARGDIVVISAEFADETPQKLVKRVIALEGDEVEVRAGTAIVNGSAEKGAYTVYVAPADLELARQIVPEGHVFVLGDNRPVSEDSRIFGTVPMDWIDGEVTWVVQPVSQARRIR